MNNKYKARGFTLMELMVTVAIVGILASISYPNYRAYVQRAQRSEGIIALEQLVTRQERYFSNNSTYAPDMATLGVSDTTENEYYTISIAPCDGGVINRCFKLTATAQGPQLNDTDCLTMTIDSTDTKTPAEGCWPD